MPEIPQYTNPIDRLEPQEGGIRAANQAAYREGRLYEQGNEALERGIRTAGQAAAGAYKQYDDVQTQKQITQGTAALGEMQLQHADQWNQTRATTDPNQLPAAAADFEQNTLGPSKDAFMGQFTTTRAQDWATRAYGNYALHAVMRTRADVASAQGDAVASNLGGALNTFAGAAVRDPSTTDASIGQFRDTLQTLQQHSPFLPKEKWQELEGKGVSQIAKAGVFGLLQRNPDAATQLLDSGKYDGVLTPADQESLRNAIKAQTHANTSDVLNAYRLHSAQQRENDRAGAENVYSNLSVGPNGEAQYPPGFGNQVLHDPDLSPATKRQMLNGFHRQLIEPARTAPGELGNLVTRLAPDSPNPLSSDEVTQLVGAGKLTEKDAGFLYRQLDPKADPTGKLLLNQTLTQARQTLVTPDGAKPSAAGAAAMSRFEGWFLPAYQAGLARGQTAAQLLSPDSPDYLMKQKPVASFAPTAGDAVASIQQAAPPTQAQQAASRAVDIALRVTGLGGSNNPDQVNALLHSAGIDLDVRNSQWCAALVNSALAKAGLQGTGSELASSFTKWGFPIDAAHIRKGDVFYAAPPPGADYTGHVGLLTGAERQGPRGLQVQVISSHLEGGGDNPAGVEWRDAHGLLLRRAQAPLDQIFGPKPAAAQPAQPAVGAGFLSHAYHYMFGTSSGPIQDNPVPEGAPQ